MASPLRISIVMPCYNAVTTVERSLKSIIGQAYPNLQLIVMDGASTDGTVEVIKSHSSAISHFESVQDNGQVDALNKGFKRADGDIFAYLCADDEYLPGTFKLVSELAGKKGAVDVFTGGCKRDFNGRETVTTLPNIRFLERLDFTNTIEQPSTFWRSSAHKRAGEFDATFKYAFDWEYWCRLKKSGAKFEAINQPLSVYYFSDTNLTSTGGRKIVDEMYRVVKKYGPNNGSLADIYLWLYETYDLKGVYDHDAVMPKWKRAIFHSTLAALYPIYGRDKIDAYNWNFASRQERGLGWKAG